MRSLLTGLALALLAACGSRPTPRSCASAADCAVSDQCSGGVCAPLTCSGALTPCSGSCVDLATAGGSCGACGHDCGGGACLGGVCQPLVVRDGLTYPVFDIDDTSVYFHSGDKVLSCPLDGCGALPPHQIGAIGATIDAANVGGVLLVGGGNVLFMAEATGSNTSGPFLHVCPIQAGCSTPPPTVAAAAHQGFNGAYAMAGGNAYWGWYKYVEHASCDSQGVCAAKEDLLASATALLSGSMAADANGVYFADPATPANLVRCPPSGPCTPELVSASPPAWTALAASNGRIYLLSSGRDGYTEGGVRSCPATAGNCTPALLAGSQPFPLAFAVDATDASWLLRDAPPSGSPMSIVTCPLSGCAGGPRLLVANQTGAYGLRSNARFVYWATATQILRVAK